MFLPVMKMLLLSFNKEVPREPRSLVSESKHNTQSSFLTTLRKRGDNTTYSALPS